MPGLLQRVLRQGGAWVNVPLYHAQFKRRRQPTQPTHAIGIYKADALGDFILALGAIHTLVERYGIEHCVLITSPAAQEFARNQFPRIAQVVVPPFSGRLWRTWSHLRRLRSTPLFQHGVDELICLRHHRYLHQDLLFNAIPSRKTYGLQRSPCGFAGEAIEGKLRYDVESDCPGTVRTDWCLDLECHATLLRRVLEREPAPGEIIPRLAPRPAAIREPWVVVAPQGAHPIRDLPLELIAAVGRDLAARRGLGLRLVASPTQAARMDRDASTLRTLGVPRVEVVTTPSLPALVDVLDRASLLVATETATAHLGAAADLPMVGIIGGGHYGRFAPWRTSSRQQWVHWPLPCYGCNWSCIHPSPICITQIPHDRVLRAAHEVLDAAA
jgi:ADP-heptose:LPS heptosyltransferase